MCDAESLKKTNVKPYSTGIQCTRYSNTHTIGKVIEKMTSTNSLLIQFVNVKWVNFDDR